MALNFKKITLRNVSTNSVTECTFLVILCWLWKLSTKILSTESLAPKGYNAIICSRALVKSTRCEHICSRRPSETGLMGFPWPPGFPRLPGLLWFPGFAVSFPALLPLLVLALLHLALLPLMLPLSKFLFSNSPNSRLRDSKFARTELCNGTEIIYSSKMFTTFNLS